MTAMMNRLLIFLFPLACAFLLPLFTFSQVVRFKHLNISDGLAQNTVTSMVQDRQGFIWIGTGGGLNRYDGYQFRIYKNDREDTSSIASNAVRCLYIDSKDRIWVGLTQGGLDMFDRASGRFTHYRYAEDGKNLLSEVVSCIAEGDNGEIWIGTGAEGVFILDPATKKFRRMKHDASDPGSISNDRIRGITRDKEGRIWIGTWSGGVNCYDPRTNKNIRYRAGEGPSSLGLDKIRAVFCDSKGRIWISTWVAGIDMYDPATGKFEHSSDKNSKLGKLDAGMIWMFTEDNEGRIWMATAERGLRCLDPETGEVKAYMHSPDDPNSISENNVWCVMKDRSGIIWSGTWTSGVNIYNPHASIIEHYQSNAHDPSTLTNNTVWCFSQLPSGEMLIGTSAGLNIFDPKKKTFARYAQQPANKHAPKDFAVIQCLYVDRSGKVWIGTNGSGISVYDPMKNSYELLNTVWDDPNSLSYNIVSDIIEDKKGTIWIATAGGGLDEYDPVEKKFIHHVHDPNNPGSISGNMVICLGIDNEGKVYAGVNDAGLNVFDPSTRKFKRYLSDPSKPGTISSNNVSCIYFDRNGQQWIGTDFGLNHFNPQTGRFSLFGTKQGLPSDIISGILEDKQGNLWLSTGIGISQFNVLERRVRNFDVSDGLQSEEFMSGSTFLASDGKMYFGGVKGFNSFYPEKVVSNTNVPAVVLTGFTVLNKPYPLSSDISLTTDISLTYRDYFFSFDFAATEYSNPSRNQYKYKMEGFDEDWVNAGSRRFATYTNLDPGEYTFRVIASNNHNVWNETGAAVRISISPPFWRTWWFYSLCGFMGVSAIFGYIRRRERNLVKERNILEEKVQQRTRELREEKEKVDAAHKDIRDSINYAKRIQEAILPLSEEFRKALPQSFVLFKPRDVVSGDFYWFIRKGDKVFFAAVDCTGHGVPGAFMSMIGNTLLNEIVNDKGITAPSAILDMLHEGVTNALKQDKQSASGSETRDGMDLALCCYDGAKNTLEYAGANRPLYRVTMHQAAAGKDAVPVLQEIKADKQPIGGSNLPTRKPFTNNIVSISPGDTIYIFTDGYIDQFGGEKGKKFMAKQFQELLLRTHAMSMEDQRQHIDAVFERWRNEVEQVDDVCVIGVRF
jgi:ligand-binding sensor domain-containing protein/serine phosphatase RsbU (regulator of sigma subunit)